MSVSQINPRFLLISDLHTESWDRDDFDLLNRSINNHELIIVAGDLGRISHISNIILALKILSSKASYLIWVPGNHEYIGSVSILDGDRIMRDIVRKSGTNIYLLNKKKLTLEISGVPIHFIGCTLWTSNQLHPTPQRDLKITSKHRYLTHMNHKIWLEYNLKKEPGKWVVITHHPPTSRFKRGDAFDEYYSNDMESIIKYSKMWCFGHLHSIKYHTFKEDGVSLYTNPIGNKSETDGDIKIEEMVINLT